MDQNLNDSFRGVLRPPLACGGGGQVFYFVMFDFRILIWAGAIWKAATTWGGHKNVSGGPWAHGAQRRRRGGGEAAVAAPPLWPLGCRGGSAASAAPGRVYVTTGRLL